MGVLPVHHVCAWCLQRSERVSGPLGLELQLFVNCHVNIEPRPSGRTGSVVGVVGRNYRKESFGFLTHGPA